MSKGYALALIFTTLSVFGSLFYLQHQVLTERHATTFAYAEAVNERVIAQKREQLDELIRKTNYLLRDDTKYRFRPIGPFIDNARVEEEKLIDAAETLDQESAKELTSLLLLRSEFLVSLSDSAVSLLETYGHLMDLSPRDIEFKAANLRKLVDQLSTTPMGYSTKLSFSLKRDLIVLEYLNVLEEVLLDVTQISGGKVISCGGYFPVFSANVYNPIRGQVVKAKVSIGSYSSALNPDDVILTAGSDTLTINPDGTADYEFSSSKRGQHKIDLRFQITNTLTGEVKTGESSYIYNIR